MGREREKVKAHFANPYNLLILEKGEQWVPY